MIYAKDNKGKLRQFTMDDPLADVEQVSTKDKVLACKMTAYQEAGLILEGAVLAVIDGGKE